MRSEVVAIRQTGAPNFLQKWKDKYPEAGLLPLEWQEFLLEFSGDVDGVLKTAIDDAVTNIAAWRGPARGEVTPPAVAWHSGYRPPSALSID